MASTPEATGGADEFAVIEALFAPLAPEAGARGLIDDAAFLESLGPSVLTMDAIVEGRHFLASDPIETVAKKALRVNVSDLAGKGARPLYYLMALQWPDGRPAGELAAFAQALGDDQKLFGMTLLGGDTSATPGPLTISVTMIGALAGARAPSRAGALAGDDVWVSGTIGDGFLGLLAAQGKLTGLSEPDLAYLAQRYRVASPRMALADLIGDLAHGSMDLSDGLLIDAEKMARASGVAIDLLAAAIPLSPAAAAWAALQPDAQGAAAALAAGGDDYELLFTAPPQSRALVAQGGQARGVALTRVGAVRAGAGLRLLNSAGEEITLGARGFSHRLGR